MRKLDFVVITGLALVGACSSNNNGDDDNNGSGTTPTASGVFPAEGFQGAALRIEITGDATNWDTTATVDFGAGITVNDVSVASPTDLFADITIDPSAASGKNDVTITGGGTFKLTQAFEIKSPLTAAITGDLVQGTIVSFIINNHNFDAPFDTSATPTMSGPAGTNWSIQANDAYSVSGFLFVDTDAAASGAISVTAGASTFSTDPVTIMPRTAVALTSGTAVNGNIAATRDSGLYTITSTATQLLDFSISTTDANAAPFVAILPSSGHWTDELTTTYVLDTAGTYYAVVADNATEAYAYTVTGNADTVTVVAEGNNTSNNTNAGAPNASAFPYEQSPSTLSSATDVDIIKVVVDANHANMTLHIVTTVGTDPATDTAVLLADAGGNPFTFDTDIFGDVTPGPVDDGAGEDTVTNPLPAGTYYLTVSAGSQFAVADNAYSVLFWYQ